MKSKALFSFAALAVVVGTMALIPQKNTQKSQHNHYVPRAERTLPHGIEGALEHYRMLRANPKTGEFDEQAMLRARDEVSSFQSRSKVSALNLQWEELGPDNIGGRTRAIMIDRSNSNNVYAGSVSGGLWYSISAGGSWKQHPDVATNLAVAAITQAANGDIYVGTGEGMYGNYGTGSGGIIGGGVYKSTDKGATFTLLASTIPTPNNSNVDWATVNRLAADPTNANRIYASTSRGLRVTDDGGATWFNPIYIGTSTVNETKISSDVNVASDGTVLCVINGVVHISPNGNDNTFTNLVTNGSGLPAGVGRVEAAFAPSDPNYIYVAATQGGNLYNVYRSTDKGNSFNSIVISNNGPVGSNTSFEPYNGQGSYNNALAVFPANKNKIIVGGVELWSWENGVGWLQIGSEFKSVFNPYYVHADKHEFQFDPNNPQVLYIGCDGGVFKSTNGASTFKEINKGYSVTQYYGVGFQLSGEFVGGGTQDNGTHLINTQTVMEGFNTLQSAVAILGGDGTHLDISASTPDAAFASSQYGNLTRSATATKGGTMSSFYETRMTSLGTPGSPGYANFVTPFRLWEGYWGDPTIPGHTYDTCFAIGLGIRDALFGTGSGVWITREALEFGKVPEWYNIALISGTITCLEFTSDGDHIFVGTSGGSLYRLDSVSFARTFDTGDLSGDFPVVDATVIETFSKSVTGIAVGSDPNHIVVTLGGYGSSTPYIYESNDALGVGTFNSVQGDLPSMPVYTAVIDRFHANRFYVGTDYGVYVSEDGGATWGAETNGTGNVPVFEVRQQELDETGAFSSRLYIATHGRGIWRSNTVTGIKPNDNVAVNELRLFPNPLRNGVGNISFQLEQDAMVEVNIYDLSGKTVWRREASHTRAGSHQIAFHGRELSAGTYIVNLRVNNTNHSEKLLVTR
ncbi:MAG: T9SS type A sorting domain-containing protein [Flavobacteriales bacterium]|nr:T9SS type A sorting domain-containing protein [Flavobacteriales bacterium]